MKNTDKVTLTLGQIKKLIAESKQINEGLKEYDARKLSYVRNYVKHLEKVKDALEANLECGYAFIDLFNEDDASPENKEWVRNFKEYNREYVKACKRLDAEWDKLPVT